MYEIKEFLLDINHLSRHISVIMPCSFVSTKKKKLYKHKTKVMSLVFSNVSLVKVIILLLKKIK